MAIYKAAFTLLELVLVLGILSIMVAVVLPFCKRSNDDLKIRQHGSNVAQAIRYAIDLAEKRKRVVEFVFSERYRSYHLQIEDAKNSFKPVEDFAGAERFIDDGIDFFDVEGFEHAGSGYYLVFDPQRPWPNAWISFSSDDLILTISIKSKHVEIEEEII